MHKEYFEYFNVSEEIIIFFHQRAELRNGWKELIQF